MFNKLRVRTSSGRRNSRGSLLCLVDDNLKLRRLIKEFGSAKYGSNLKQIETIFGSVLQDNVSNFAQLNTLGGDSVLLENSHVLLDIDLGNVIQSLLGEGLLGLSPAHPIEPNNMLQAIWEAKAVVDRN